jgi:murein DD-endopeptidase MepM/ murein hydrolase activator NlpD
MKFHKIRTSFLLIITVGVIIVISAVLYVLLISQEESSPQVTEPLRIHTYAYNIHIDSLDIRYGIIKNNQNLSDILTSHISGNLIDKIARETADVFDIRKIRTGQKYALITTKDSLHRLNYFIYELNPIDFIVYDFRDSLRVYRDKKKVLKEVRSAKGIISTSLWNTMDENHLDVDLILRMAAVYAWTVDFYGLQKGDDFKVIYEQVLVDSIPVSSDRIIAALFRSGGKDFYAFYFEQKNDKGYFDDKGQSLRRSFLKAPLHFSRISSRFSRARMHPILRIVRPHFGVDYSAPRGTPVVSLGDGRVLEAGWKGGYGRYISIRHNSVYTSSYAHLSGYAKGIKAGASVKQGDVVGYVGSSGLSTGAHLDFRVYHNGSPVDPLKIESPPTDPVAQGSIDQYRKLVSKLKEQLDSL